MDDTVDSVTHPTRLRASSGFTGRFEPSRAHEESPAKAGLFGFSLRARAAERMLAPDSGMACRYTTFRRCLTSCSWPFTLRNLKEDLEDLGSRFDGAPDLEFRLATEALELEKSGLSYQSVPPTNR
jgi:hypothetical protein